MPYLKLQGKPYAHDVKQRSDAPPPPIINTESVILQNAPHSQCLLAMGRIAFLWGGWTLQNKFAKTGEIKGDTYLHGVRYDNKKFLRFVVFYCDLRRDSHLQLHK